MWQSLGSASHAQVSVRFVNPSCSAPTVGVRKKRAVTFDAPAAPEDGAPQDATPPQRALARSNSDDFQENDGVAAEDDDSDDDDSDEDFGGLATDKEDRYGCLQVLTETHLIAGACPPRHP